MDLNMPELLAMDLKTGVFTTTSMTAGASPPRLAAESYGRQYSLRDFSPPRSESHHRQHMLAKMRSFGTADEYRRSSANRHRPAPLTKTIQGLHQNQLALPTGYPGDISRFRQGHEHSYPAAAGPKHPEASAPPPAAMYDDTTSESSYGEAAPPSIRGRKQSVTTTAATSVESARCSSAMSHHKRSAAAMATPAQTLERGHQESWMDFDADFTPNPYHHDKAGDRTSWDTDSSAGMQQHHPSTSMNVHSQANDKDCDNNRDSASIASVRIPKRRSSLSHRITVTGPESLTHSREQSLDTYSSPAKQVISATVDQDFGADRMALPLPVLPVDMTELRAARKAPSQKSRYDENGRSDSLRLPNPAESISGKWSAQKEMLKPPPPHHRTNMDSFNQNRDTTPQQPSAPSPSSRSSINVESWLESSVQLGLGRVTPPPPCRETIATVGVPLPRALIDNLHIYVTGFPEVMLTPTAMVFETIRSHSRQMKRPGCGGAGGGAEAGSMKVIDEDVFRPDSTSSSRSTGKSSSRRWNPLKRLNLSSKSSAPSPTFPSPYASYSRGNGLPPSPVSPTNSDPTSTSPRTLSAEGQRIRRVFGPSAPGYLCEALYAHILAYNYISVLLPVQAPPAATTASHALVPARPDTPSSEMDDLSDEPPPIPGKSGKSKRIPTKAATLLGLDAFSSGPAAGSIRNRSQASLALNTGIGSCARGPEPDPSVRILHTGLAGCIGLLVSTLRLVTGKETGAAAGDEEGQAKKLDGEAKKAVDPILLGALCEVVRCAEEVR